AVSAERAATKARVQIFEVDGLAAERGLQSDLIERRVLDAAGAGAQVCTATHRTGNACDVYAARGRPGGGQLSSDAALLRGRQGSNEAANINAVERRVERDVICACARDVERKLCVAAVGLCEPAVGDACGVRVGFNRSGQRAEVAAVDHERAERDAPTDERIIETPAHRAVKIEIAREVYAVVRQLIFERRRET